MGAAAPAGSADADVDGDGVDGTADEVAGGEGWAGGVGVHEVSRKLIPSPAASAEAARRFFKVFSWWFRVSYGGPGVSRCLV